MLDETFLRKKQQVSYRHILNRMTDSAMYLMTPTEGVEDGLTDIEVIESVVEEFSDAYEMVERIGNDFDAPDDWDVSDDCKTLVEEAVRRAREDVPRANPT